MFTTAIGAIKALDQVFSILDKSGKHNLVKNLEDADKRGVLYSTGSITKLLSKFVIEPTVLVSNSLKTDEAIENAIKLNVDMFTAFYSQAFSVLAQVHNLDSTTTFDLLSSNYGNGELGFSSESGDELPILADSNVPVFLSTEAKDSGKKFTKTELSDTYKTMIREVEVTMNVKNQSGVNTPIKMNVMIKANIVFTNYDDISKMISVSDTNKTFASRWDDYRSGAIGLGDLIFATSLVEEYKDKRLKDSKEIIKKMEDRSRVSASKLATSGALGFGKYYQMVIVNDSEKANIERLISGKLDKSKYKEKLLEQINSMSITTMNSDFERLTVYIKDLSGQSEYSYKSLKKTKGTDDLSDVLKNMLASRMI